MGNSNEKDNSSSEYGSIYVEVNTKVVVPNDTIFGTVYMILKDDYPADSLFFKLYGYEEVHFWEHYTYSDGNETKDAWIPYDEKREFVDQEIEMFNWKNYGGLRAGHYSFPVQFLVPSGLPGTFYYNYDWNYGEIRYQISAFLRSTKKEVSNLDYKFDLIVRELPIMDVSTKEHEAYAEIKCCCCCKNGTVKMKTFFEKNSYSPEEVCNVASDIDCSEAKVNMKKVKFNLTHHCDFVANGKHRKFDYAAVSEPLGQMKKGEKWIGENRKFAKLRDYTFR